MSVGNITVYLGAWTYEKDGPVYGRTLTLSSDHAQVFSAFLATFIAFTGSQLWRLLAFAIHQIRASTKPTDGLHHQQLATLRNSASPTDTAWTLFRLSWAWRKKGVRTFSFPWILLVGLYSLAVAVAAIFASSEISKVATHLRLLTPGKCGSVGVEAISLSDRSAYWTNFSNSVAGWVNDCYSGLDDFARCQILPVPRVNFTTKEVDCPFNSSICRPNVPAFQMDTGPMLTSEVYGINVPRDDSMMYRRVSTCAPLDEEPYQLFRSKGNSSAGSGDSDT